MLNTYKIDDCINIANFIDRVKLTYSHNGKNVGLSDSVLKMTTAYLRNTVNKGTVGNTLSVSQSCSFKCGGRAVSVPMEDATTLAGYSNKVVDCYDVFYNMVKHDILPQAYDVKKNFISRYCPVGVASSLY